MFEINNLTNEEISELGEIKKFLDFALKKLSLKDVLFGVIITDNKMIRELNKNYRNIDRETDVISFALEDDNTFKNDQLRVLGDIYISIDKAREQSIEYGHSLLREIAFLTIHGLLHLLGYDHMKKEDEEVMFKLQEEVLGEYGINR